MYDTILVPTDGSDGTAEALDHAVEMARRYDAGLHALAVVDERQFEQVGDEHREDTRATFREHCERAVESVARRTREADVPVETTVRSGVPSQRIVELATEGDVDVIVMGTHGRSDAERIATVGSVTQRVVENADVPVFVVHIGGATGWGGGPGD